MSPSSDRRSAACRGFTAFIGASLIAGCSGLGEAFESDHASRVRNGMTREEVIAIMGSPPARVEGTDPGKLTWIDAAADPLNYYYEKVSFSFDENGKVYGIPEPGRIGSFKPDNGPIPWWYP